MGLLVQGQWRNQAPHPARMATGIAEHAADDTLTAREIEVLEGVAAGKSNKLIAAALAVSEGTVKMHMKSILPKLAARDRTHAVSAVDGERRHMPSS
jgi:DNA-binding NarL/FixJ family response regulator